MTHGPVLEQGAREQIGAAAYPDNWPQLTKLEALKYATERVKREVRHQWLTWEKTPITVSFEERAHNKTGYVQPPCNLYGNCSSGCITGAKNTVNTNYSADAWAHGSDIFDRHDGQACGEGAEARWQHPPLRRAPQAHRHAG